MTDDFPIHLTYGDKYGPAMAITDQAAADAYFQKCVRHSVAMGRPEAEAIDIERRNLGYYAGYYSHETRARVERLFRCAHPVFGAIAEKGPPTAEQAFQMGLDMANSTNDTPRH